MIITEIVKMKTMEGIAKDQFVKIIDGLEKNFHSRQMGFIDSELLYHEEENEWYLIQHWSSKDDLKEASKKMFIDQEAEAFVNSLDKQSIKMLVLPQIDKWI